MALMCHTKINKRKESKSCHTTASDSKIFRPI